MAPSRTAYAAMAAAAILIGLAVHLHGSALGITARDFGGDALWAVMISALVSVLVPQRARIVRCVAALCICFLVEGSQLLHTPILDGIRATFVGHLVLGSGFDARDLVAYTVGTLLFAAMDHRWISVVADPTTYHPPNTP